MKIIISGDPIPQPRLRHFVRGGKALCYDPVKKQKEEIKALFENIISRFDFPYEFPRNPRISFFFFCKAPSSLPKAIRSLAETGWLRKRTRPDCDNYVKLYLDCMNEILIEDDSHASLGSVEKFYHLEPKTVIFIDEADEILNMPLDGPGHSLESYEWIREKTACLNGLLFHPFSGFARCFEDPVRPKISPPSS